MTFRSGFPPRKQPPGLSDRHRPAVGLQLHDQQILAAQQHQVGIGLGQLP